jgi:hypothetical protein
MAAQNADEAKTNAAGLPEAQEGNVKIEATTKADLHLGDDRVIWGDGDGLHGDTDAETGEAYAYPNQAMVTKEVADALVKAKKAKRV